MRVKEEIPLTVIDPKLEKSEPGPHQGWLFGQGQAPKERHAESVSIMDTKDTTQPIARTVAPFVLDRALNFNP